MSRIQLDIWNERCCALEKGVSAYTSGLAGYSVDELAGGFAAEWTQEQFTCWSVIIGK
jgi:hypothetical protein